MSFDGINSVAAMIGLLMYKSFLVTEAETKHVRRRVRFQQHGDASCYHVFSVRQCAEKNQAILTKTLGEHASSDATVKKWLAQFKRGDFSICVACCPGRHKTVTTPEIIYQNHDLIFEGRRISAKSIDEQLGNSRKRVRSVIHKGLDIQTLSAKWLT